LDLTLFVHTTVIGALTTAGQRRTNKYGQPPKPRIDLKALLLGPRK